MMERFAQARPLYQRSRREDERLVRRCQGHLCIMYQVSRLLHDVGTAKRATVRVFEGLAQSSELHSKALQFVSSQTSQRLCSPTGRSTLGCRKTSIPVGAVKWSALERPSKRGVVGIPWYRSLASSVKGTSGLFSGAALCCEVKDIWSERRRSPPAENIPKVLVAVSSAPNSRETLAVRGRVRPEPTQKWRSMASREHHGSLQRGQPS